MHPSLNKQFTFQMRSNKILKMIRKITFLVLIFAYNFELIKSFDVIFERVELLNSSYVEGFYNFSNVRIQKYNRTTFVLNLNFELFIDFDEDVFCEVTFSYNRFNNRQFALTPVHIKKQPFCNMTEGYYKRFVMLQVKDLSNFPQFELEEAPCPFKKVIILHIFMSQMIIAILTIENFIEGLILVEKLRFRS